MPQSGGRGGEGKRGRARRVRHEEVDRPSELADLPTVSATYILDRMRTVLLPPTVFLFCLES